MRAQLQHQIQRPRGLKRAIAPQDVGVHEAVQSMHFTASLVHVHEFLQTNHLPHFKAAAGTAFAFANELRFVDCRLRPLANLGSCIEVCHAELIAEPRTGVACRRGRGRGRCDGMCFRSLRTHAPEPLHTIPFSLSLLLALALHPNALHLLRSLCLPFPPSAAHRPALCLSLCRRLQPVIAVLPLDHVTGRSGSERRDHRLFARPHRPRNAILETLQQLVLLHAGHREVEALADVPQRPDTEGLEQALRGHGVQPIPHCRVRAHPSRCAGRPRVPRLRRGRGAWRRGRRPHRPRRAGDGERRDGRRGGAPADRGCRDRGPCGATTDGGRGDRGDTGQGTESGGRGQHWRGQRARGGAHVAVPEQQPALGGGARVRGHAVVRHAPALDLIRGLRERQGGGGGGHCGGHRRARGGDGLRGAGLGGGGLKSPGQRAVPGVGGQGRGLGRGGWKARRRCGGHVVYVGGLCRSRHRCATQTGL
mmetsp:Transcript_103647/g.175404  ORF Transcript_103647/g.175404 Transcript_103647/m.175404 type:complete len:478 (-) Transcript_103647:2546-3979(-)